MKLYIDDFEINVTAKFTNEKRHNKRATVYALNRLALILIEYARKAEHRLYDDEYVENVVWTIDKAIEEEKIFG